MITGIIRAFAKTFIMEGGMTGAKGTAAFWNAEFASRDVSVGEWDVRERKLFDKCIGFFRDVTGKKVLEIGCGLGRNSIYLAALGAQVTAVDISATAIDKLNLYASEQGLSIKGVVHDALKIADLGEFDFVVGWMILHHLEPFSSFCEALFSTIKPGGKAFFYENNAASRLLVWMRENAVGKMWIPKYGDPNEFPLKPQEVDMLRRRFEVEQYYPELMFFRLASPYLFRRYGRTLMTSVDDFLYRRGIMLKYSYRQVLLLTKPKS